MKVHLKLTTPYIPETCVSPVTKFGCADDSNDNEIIEAFQQLIECNLITEDIEQIISSTNEDVCKHKLYSRTLVPLHTLATECDNSHTYP